MAERYGFLTRLTDLLFPPRCAGCGEFLDFSKIGKSDALCTVCKPIWDAEKQEICGRCFEPVCQCECMTELVEKAGCKTLCKLVYYRHGIRATVQNQVVYRIKNQRDRRTHRFLANEIQSVLEQKLEKLGLPKENCVLVYIPRRKVAVLESGTDQGEELARAISLRIGIPVCHCIARTKGKHKEQKKLTAQGRLENVRSAFSIRNGTDLKGKTVFLVDDIVTTGASMTACAKKLKHAGAKEIYCICVASDNANQYPDVAQPKKRADFTQTR